MNQKTYPSRNHRLISGSLIFLILCLLIQYSPVIFGFAISKNGATEKVAPNQIHISLSHLQPDRYYVALGRALGSWDLLLDDKVIASSKGISQDLKGSLSLGGGFVITDSFKPQQLILRTESTEQWRAQLWRVPIVASYYPGLILQSWLTFNDLYLGPSFAILLLLSITIYARVSTVTTERIKALLFIAITTLIYTGWVAGFADLFVKMPFSTAIQVILRAVFSISILYFYGTYSQQNKVLMALHFISVAAAIVTGLFFPLFAIQIYKLVIVLASVSIVTALVQTIIRRVEIEPILLQLGLALCILQVVSTVTYLISGPSFYTLITPATVAVFAIAGMAAAYKEIQQKIIDQESVKAELESKARLNALATQIAHDIRSPLATLTVALRGMSSSSSEYGALATMATQRIENIANDLLVEYRDTKQIAPPHGVELVSILKQSIKEKQTEFLQHNRLKIDLVIDSEIIQCKAIADTNELFRSLSNIINNSAEAMSFVGKISVTLFQKDKSALIQIKDEGPGIPNEIIQKLGTPGVSLGKRHGHGLGLSYVASVVSKWGGKLEYNSEQQQGTSISITLARANS